MTEVMTESPEKVFEVKEVRKIPLILFSGGLDSTFLLYETLKTSDADILYVKGPQGKHKIDAELKARDKILSYLENTDNVKFKVRRSYMVESSKHPAEDHAFGQIGPWFMGGMDTYIVSRHSEVQIAYVSSDGITSRLSTITRAWDALAAAYKSELVPLKFPLQNYGKYDILQRIPYDLYMLTWVCELPVVETDYFTKSTECGKCPACITRKVEEYRYELKTGVGYHAKYEKINEVLETLVEEPAKSTEGLVDVIEDELPVSDRIVCAANMYPDGEIVLGVRHFDPFMQRAIERRLNGDAIAKDMVQGFVDGKGMFLTREEALVRATLHKQIVRSVGGDTKRLFSENIH